MLKSILQARGVILRLIKISLQAFYFKLEMFPLVGLLWKQLEPSTNALVAKNNPIDVRCARI